MLVLFEFRWRGERGTAVTAGVGPCFWLRVVLGARACDTWTGMAWGSETMGMSVRHRGLVGSVEHVWSEVACLYASDILTEGEEEGGGSETIVLMGRCLYRPADVPLRVLVLIIPRDLQWSRREGESFMPVCFCLISVELRVSLQPEGSVFWTAGACMICWWQSIFKSVLTAMADTVRCAERKRKQFTAFCMFGEKYGRGTQRKYKKIETADNKR